jgi:hypothetical protein
MISWNGGLCSVEKNNKFASERKYNYSPTAVDCMRPEIISTVNFLIPNIKQGHFFLEHLSFDY